METLMTKVNWGLSAVTVGHSYSSWCHSCLEVAMPPLTHSLPSLCVPSLVLNVHLFLIPVNQEAETMTRSHGTYNFERAMSSNAIPLVSPMAFIVVLQTQDWFFQSLWRHYRFKPIHCLLTYYNYIVMSFLRFWRYLCWSPEPLTSTFNTPIRSIHSFNTQFTLLDAVKVAFLKFRPILCLFY